MTIRIVTVVASLVAVLLAACSSRAPTGARPVPPIADVGRKNLIPVEAFASLPQVTALKFSPSGKRLAYFLNVKGDTYLVAKERRAEAFNALIKSDNSEYVMTDFDWVSDERLLVKSRFPERRRGSGIIHPETRMVAVNWDGTDLKMDLVRIDVWSGQHYDVPQFQDALVHLLPDDDRHVLISLDLDEPVHPDVYRLDVFSGKRTRVQRHRSDINRWMADRQGRVRLGIGWSGGKLRVKYKDLRDGAWRDLGELNTLGEGDLDPMGFEADPNVLYVRKYHQGRLAVFKVQLDRPDEPWEMLAADPVYDVLGSLIYFPWVGRAVGIRHADNHNRLIYWDDDARQLQARVDRSLPGRANFIESSAGEGFYLVVSGNATHPPSYYLFDDHTGRASLLIDTYPDLDPEQLVVPRKVSFTARDGVTMEGYLSLPHDWDERRLPMIIFPHGGPTARATGAFNYWTQFFVSRGWGVMEPNFRGSTGYGRAFLRAGLQHWGLEMQDDIADSVQWLKAQGIADPARICIVGGSYGGYAALMGIVKDPELFRCAVSFAGPSDLQMLLDDFSKFYKGQERIEPTIGHWWWDRQRLKETSPINFASRINTPVLIAHGVQDTRVPVAHSREMARALEREGFGKFQYVELEQSDHHLSSQADRVRFFKEMENFLASYLN